jgi:hypothetical protein
VYGWLMPLLPRLFGFLAFILAVALLNNVVAQSTVDDPARGPSRGASWMALANESDADASRLSRRIHNTFSTDDFILPALIPAPVGLNASRASVAAAAKVYKRNLVYLI